MLKIISQTKNGRVFLCPACNMVHFEYKNLNFNFEYKKEYEHFAKYFLNLDGEYWEDRNARSYFRRKIIVPIGHRNFNIHLNNTELLELKELFSNAMESREEKALDVYSFCFCKN